MYSSLNGFRSLHSHPNQNIPFINNDDELLTGSFFDHDRASGSLTPSCKSSRVDFPKLIQYAFEVDKWNHFISVSAVGKKPLNINESHRTY